jgi:serine/threonine protein kinase
METSINPDPVIAILQEALQQQPEEREAYVRSACDGDHELYRKLADALQWEERMGNFLLEPLVDFTLLVRPFEPGQTTGDGRFEILREIGEGGMGLVYEAFDRKLQQNIAIKAAKPGFQRLLSPELKAALKVRHQNICLVKEIHTAQTDYGEVDFLAMELLEGETLSAHLAKAGRLPHEEALGIACQVCAGLAEAHRSGIIHRDLKSGNVILCKNEDGGRRAVITDFGLAGGTAVTSGEVAGTPAYMAPELWRGEPPSKASDVYALGVLLYEMVAGRRPHQADESSDDLGTTCPLLTSFTEEQWQHRAYTEPPEPPSRFVKHLDPRWDRAIMRCIQSSPSERPDASEVLSQLQRKRLPKALFAVPVLLILVLTAIVGLVRPVRQRAIGSLLRPHIPDLKERQITDNPIEDWVVGAALSTDGKQVAYKDNIGLYLRSIDSDETRPISVPADLRDRMYSVLWVPFREQLLAGVGSPNGFDLWIISLSGELKPSLLYRNADSPAISPDGRSIVFVPSEFGHSRNELWVGNTNGDAPRKLLDVGATGVVFAPTWSPDGRSIAYARQWKTTNGSSRDAIEVRPAVGGSAKTLVDEGSLPESDIGLAWT